MYSVFLVDDEMVIRKGIRNSIPWDETPFTLAGEAPDGEIALSRINELSPDIIITDIRMPFLDGLALSKIIRKTQPRIKIIVLSGHDEFEYAKEAISIGVEEYLLKPVSSSELLEVLNKVASRIEQDKERMKDMEDLRTKVLSSEEIRRERWYCDLVAGLIPSKAALEQSREMGLELIALGYLVAVFQLFPAPEGNGSLLAARSMIKEFLSGRDDIIAFSEGAERLILIIKKSDKKGIEEKTRELISILKKETEARTSCRLAVGTGAPVTRIGELPFSYAKAEESLFPVEDEKPESLGRDNSDSPLFKGGINLIPPEVNLIACRLKYAVLDDVDEMICSYTDLLNEIPDHSPFLCSYLLGDLIVAATKVFKDLGGNINDILPEILEKERLEAVTSSRENFCSHIRNMIERMIEYRDSQNESRHHTLVRKAREYMEARFADPDISLQRVAEHVNVSPNHLSTLFSQESGQSFIDHLTSIRVAHAKHLMRTSGLKIGDIGYRCGFTDPHYFSFFFKKNTGSTPRDFRSVKNTN